MKRLRFKILLLAVGLVSSISIFGQETNDQKNLEKPNSIFFAPLNLLDPINPSFQIGYERMLNQKWGFQIEYGYIINKGLINILLNPHERPDEYSNKGFKLRVELKRVIIRKKRFLVYASGEFFYLKNRSDVINQFLVSDPSFVYSFGVVPNPGENYYYDDYFTNEKIKFGTNIKGGIKVFTGPVFFEAHLGLGIVYRKNSHSNRENLNDPSLDDSFLNDNLIGEKILLNLPFNIKMGFRF